MPRVGIATTPEVMPHAVWVPRANRHEFSLFTYFWTIDTPEPSIMLISQLATPDAARRHRHDAGGDAACGVGAARQSSRVQPVHLLLDHRYARAVDHADQPARHARCRASASPRRRR